MACLAAMIVLSVGVVCGGSAKAGVIGQWNFDETSGTVAHDTAGSADDGTLTGSVAFSGGALTFSGGSVQVGSSLLSQVQSTQQMSFAAWIDPTSFGSYKTIFDDNNRQFSFWINSATNGFQGTQGFGGGLNYSTPFTLDEWQYLVVTYIAGNGSTPGVYDVYRDGVLVASAATSGAATFNQPFVIGGNPSGGGSPFLGQMKDVQFYDNALTLAQVQDLSGVTATPEPASLAMFAAGLAGLGVARRRIKSARPARSPSSRRA